MAVTLTNNLNLWDSQKTNYTTSANLVSDTQRLNGFQQSEYLKSATFNGFFMELSLVTLSVIDALASVTSAASVSLTVNNDTSRTNLSAAIKTILEGLSVHYAETTGAATSATQATNLASGAKGSIPYQSAQNATTFLPKGTQGQILAQGANDTPTWINPGTLTVQSAATATTATTATNVGNLTNDDTGANTTIAFSIGNKSYSKTITVAIPGTVASAETVTANIQINGTNKAISTLFENNGDAKKATYATSAGTATSATNANYATTAGTAGSANTATTATTATTANSAASAAEATTVTGNIRISNNEVSINSIFAPDGSANSAIHADTADSATTAASADYATSAGSANTATTAESAYSCTEAIISNRTESTDFTNEGWSTVDIDSGATLTKGGTYEIQVNKSATYPNQWSPFPLVTLPTGTTGGATAVCWLNGSQYVEFDYDIGRGTGIVSRSITYTDSTKWRYRKIR